MRCGESASGDKTNGRGARKRPALMLTLPAVRPGRPYQYTERKTEATPKPIIVSFVSHFSV